MSIIRINTYDDDRFSQEALIQPCHKRLELGLT